MKLFFLLCLHLPTVKTWKVVNPQFTFPSDAPTSIPVFPERLASSSVRIWPRMLSRICMKLIFEENVHKNSSRSTRKLDWLWHWLLQKALSHPCKDSTPSMLMGYALGWGWGPGGTYVKYPFMWNRKMTSSCPVKTVCISGVDLISGVAEFKWILWSRESWDVSGHCLESQETSSKCPVFEKKPQPPEKDEGSSLFRPWKSLGNGDRWPWSKALTAL